MIPIINLSSKKSIIIIAGVVVLLLLIVGGIFIFTHITEKPIDSSAIVIDNIQVNAKNIQISGDTSYSAAFYNKYTYKLEDGALYIKLYYSSISSKGKTGNFDIKIDGDFKNINKVYLQGNSKEDAKLIWTQNR